MEILTYIGGFVASIQLLIWLNGLGIKNFIAIVKYGLYKASIFSFGYVWIFCFIGVAPEFSDDFFQDIYIAFKFMFFLGLLIGTYSKASRLIISTGER
jgi:sterol desaturase/sphingolipid hydroxylase (fatty acid hydroxylase superfamily)